MKLFYNELPTIYVIGRHLTWFSLDFNVVNSIIDRVSSVYYIL